MKLFSSIMSGITLILYFNVSSAQIARNTQPSNKKNEIENLVNQSDLVVEAHVLGTKGFKTKTGIYTSAEVQILKLFKGNLSDSIIEVVYEFGQVDGEGSYPSDGGWFALGAEEECVLFLNTNKSEIILRRDRESYIPSHGLASLIGYTGSSSESLEKGLFAQIESITQQKRKVFGLNQFERPSKLSIEAKVANSDVILEGVVISRQGFHIDTVIRKGKINNYVSVVVKISKLFKGDVKDSLVELVYLDGGLDESLRDSYGFSVTDNEDGVFFLANNQTNVSHSNSLASYIPSYGRNSFARYKWADPANTSYVAECFKTIYHDVEKDLFEKIESLTGRKRTILRPNLFEK